MSETQKPPTSIDEYNERYHRNMMMEGHGMETANVMPCPFCAAPRFAVVKVVDTLDAMQTERTCSECGRSGKAFVEQNESTTRMEFVQTGGPDLPDWYYPKMRRVDR